MFDHFLHERGYTYVGPTSLYRLSIPEIKRLYDGYAEWRKREEAAKHGVPPEKAGDVDIRNHPRARNSTQLREGDFNVAEQFMDN